MRDVRAKALEKIASLSAASSTTALDRSDLDKLCRACHAGARGRDIAHGGPGAKQAGSLGRVPMSIREFEVLLALCKSAPSIQSSQSAQRLSYQLIPYMLEAHSQAFVPSPFFRRIEPSPTESLAFHVAGALLALGLNFGDLKDTVADGIWAFTISCGKVIETVVSQVGDPENPTMEDAVRTATIALALLGFLDAASAQADFWKAGSRLGMIQKLKQLLSEPFLVALETSLSTIRNSHSQDRETKEWKRLLRHYASSGRPLGAMLLQRSFMWLVLSSAALMVADGPTLRANHVLDLLMSEGGHGQSEPDRFLDSDLKAIETYTGLAVEKMDYIEADADFVRLGSPNQQKLAYAVKSAAMITFLNCSLLNDQIAEVDVLMGWLQETLEDPTQMADNALASVVLRCLALICRIAPAVSSTVIRVLPRFLVQSAPRGDTVGVASRSLAFVLKTLSEDAVISTLYTLGNVLSPVSDGIAANGQANGTAAGEAIPPVYAGRHSTGSSISLQMNGEEETAIVYGNVVQAICGIATACQDEKITALAQSMLLQKVDKVNADVDAHVISGAATLALMGGQLEFRALLKMYSRICHIGIVENKEFLLAAVMKARTHVSANLRRDSPLFDIYWEHLLDSIISLGDVESSSHTRESDVKLVAQEIGELLRPLAVFMASNDLASGPIEDDEARSLLRDAWFNIVVHGLTTGTDRGKKYWNELRTIAVHSPPLITGERSEQVESDIELNTVLRRGNTNEREATQKKLLSELIPTKAADIKSLSYRKVIFLQAAYLVESLRADSGDCTKVLSYFLEPSMRKGEVSGTMEGIASAVVDRYLKKTLGGADPPFSAQYAATQLAAIFCKCCHRIERVQQAALQCADRIIRDVPSVLCYRSSLFALLELLSLMWSSCLEAETDLYTPRSTFSSELGKVTVELSDDFDYRRWTLDILNRKAKIWVSAAIGLAPLDIKGLLQTYLSEFDDEGAYGHISLGRSFALGLGSIIPSTDTRLQSLGRVGDCDINTASDLIAQYTTRQEYRYGETLPDTGNELIALANLKLRPTLSQSSVTDSANASTALAHVEARILSKKAPSLNEVRDILRRAAALLCRSSRDESAVARYLVSIPFSLFTKQSIKLGVSLWLGVMNENPRLEPKLLSSIAQQWEFTITRKREEFAPSELETLAKKRQSIHDMLSPHTRLLQFFSSHLNATRLGSGDTQRVFLRMLDLTMNAIKDSTSHPMARELHFQTVLFGLKVLRTSTTIGATAQWRLKEKILSAGLSWFRNSPGWSYGSNVLQLKTEVRLISDVLAALKVVSFIGAHTIGNVKSLQAKEQLLQLLLENEQARLNVWISPLNQHSSHFSLLNASKATDPCIAIELATRFHFPRLHREIRQLLLSKPERAVSEPEALALMFGGHLPDDVNLQLKHLLYWQPVNPLTAVSMFLPAYKDHPFLIQYAMRALESHSIDVTFFYVPQIVQTLRYDTLGYVERFILQTAQFSQLFAHQIIWNMKANSYKDDDAQVPDEIKPTLDSVMEKMVDSFAAEDKDFYEREFAFFDEVTGISGKLKPLIRRPKPEKKQKIEEELRKIKVEVGVYLPSNPDGVVIGIDRKSGKPLQSHAKAPYMATFRIRKKKTGGPDAGVLPEEASKQGQDAKDNMVEAWQSAIFKVGDDCRQDVLALQMIAAFRGIFHSVGLEVYVFPYRVTATAPGCGVIDVLPNSISRDMLGREAVNGLYDYFVSKYGNEDSLRFQQARNNFVKSMAAYSVISFLLQFKDRHNGNIMVDDAGHILHIDFGFCFDIAPGGIKFERAPFKLTSEMVAVMGGSTDHQSFKWFEELCVKAFLASRQYCDKLSQIVLLMMDSGLPCFKPESVKHFRERFVLDRTEREAADFMKDLIKKSFSSYSTGIYDQFQLLTNGIPY
ncbi:phosphatidylinositol 3- and 4-kinase domain-containing protein [Hirsutella rhossiliensis]|uniref:1-phosphatidylinositol 4-kinase n=1 Tax=Hirsutella rhossiliensis TaxID=111463 RepID=A0A9P8MLS1_9HYPO|nr:phosphatidylinositol 3- and 4-kinase domain-containing protein [Hirsutella rhossiliensis]KAH0957475.1 phosphatidylinositol 3- and 4-kinase domain-containing protein [Hirsutella rhossiliensis]